MNNCGSKSNAARGGCVLLLLEAGDGTWVGENGPGGFWSDETGGRWESLFASSASLTLGAFPRGEGFMRTPQRLLLEEKLSAARLTDEVEIAPPVPLTCRRLLLLFCQKRRVFPEKKGLPAPAKTDIKTPAGGRACSGGRLFRC